MKKIVEKRDKFNMVLYFSNGEADCSATYFDAFNFIDILSSNKE